MTEALREKRRAMQTVLDECGGQLSVLEYDRVALPNIESQILGRLGELVQPLEAKYSKALSIGATHNLWRVVVADDAVAESLLTKGRLRARTSFFPLNKIKSGGSALDPAKLAAAKNIARQFGGDVFVAKDLVRHDPAISEIIAVTFGNWVVCSSLQLARELAFDSRTKIRAVSLAGEVADPKGTLSGGSSRELRDHLNELNLNAARRAPAAALRKEAESIAAKLEEARARLGQGAQLKRQLEDAEDEFETQQQRAHGGSVTASLQAEIAENAAAQADASRREEELEHTKAQLIERQTKLQQLQAEDPAKVEKELNGKLREAVQEVKAFKAEAEAGSQQHDTAEADVEQLAGAVERRRRELADEDRALRQEVADKSASLVTLRAELDQLARQVAEAEAAIADMDTRLEASVESLQKLTTALADAESKLKSADAAKKNLRGAMDEGLKRMQDAERTNPWIPREMGDFGNPAGRFYFLDAARTADELAAIEECERKKLAMAKKFGRGAASTLVGQEDVSKDYDRVLRERQMLVEDKESIRSAITTIEQKKWAALDTKSAQVSQVFSQLFGMCLPGASATLREERDASGHITGLEVKAAFNNKEKESLTELSGGQRSLLALCLILAILRLNPAPIYILDEVDAALDPSHTQNIGAMLQKYFSNAQFLLISLKDGMFNNANVLFEIRNTQGFSEISRRQARRQ
jgi:structural maintenance of chromosome 2